MLTEIKDLLLHLREKVHFEKADFIVLLIAIVLSVSMLIAWLWIAKLIAWIFVWCFSIPLR